MPRKTRIDHPGMLNHVIFRGIERRVIFHDEEDYKEFLFRLKGVKNDAQVFAWALMPNHGHLLIRSGREGLAHLMRRLLTGYAVYFNHRHKRVGHLFQNRYKSIVCDEDNYFKRLVAYIHLNPLKALLVKDLKDLAQYPWCGHGAMMGTTEVPWQAVEASRAYFGDTADKAGQEYLKHLVNAMNDSSSPNYDGGGLFRSAGGLDQVLERRRQGDHQASDPRILGNGDFVNTVLETEVRKISPQVDWKETKERVLSYFGVKEPELAGGLRRQTLAKAREALVYVGLKRGRKTGQELAEELKKSRAAISQAYYRACEWIKGDEPWLNAN